jgi:hypothetical protein
MKKTLFLIACFTLIFSFKATCQLTNSLEEYYKFDEASGQAVNSIFPGTNNSSSVTANYGAAGKINNAFSFNGTTSIVSFADNANWTINTTDNLSISMWIYLTADVTANGYACLWGNQTGPEFYLIFVSAGNYKIGWWAGNTESKTNSMTFSLNTWYHIILTKNGTAVNFYRNGTNVGSATAVDNNINPTGVYVGSNTHTTPESFNGRIDEVGIWKRALTATEVTSLYNSGNGLAYPFGQTLYNFSVSVSPTNGGTVTMSPTGGNYPAGTNVTVTASPNSGYTFIGWNGSITTNPYTITVNATSGITAVFITGTTYTLTTNCSPTAGGTISLSPGGGLYGPNSTVTATAIPNSGYAFTGWSAPDNASPNPFSITMNANKSIAASFTALPSVTTNVPVTSIAQNSASSGGNVTSQGGANVTARGVCWNTQTNPTTANSKSVDGTGTGTFTSAMTGLTAGTTYYVRAYATSSAGTSYGSEVVFTTLGASWQTNGSNIYYSFGKVSIGTTIANSASALTVNGKILATEVEVVSSIAADYVFEPEYQLMPLTDLELYLKQNKHLPGIPSVAEFSKQGQNLGKMDDMLLRKIEELTLYIINLEQKINNQNEMIEELRMKIKD